MSSQPPVVINKAKSVWHSIFWASSLMVVGVTACACVTGLVALNILGEHFDRSLSLAGNLTETMQNWKTTFPPALADAINDRRDLDYVKSMEVKCRLVPDERGRDQNIVVTVTNNGDKVVSLAAIRVTGMSANGVPVYEQPSYAATPIAVEDEWRGPLLPGSKRTFAVRHSIRGRKIESAEAEIIELRTWLGPIELTPGDVIDKQAGAKARETLRNSRVIRDSTIVPVEEVPADGRAVVAAEVEEER